MAFFSNLHLFYCCCCCGNYANVRIVRSEVWSSLLLLQCHLSLREFKCLYFFPPIKSWLVTFDCFSFDFLSFINRSSPPFFRLGPTIPWEGWLEGGSCFLWPSFMCWVYWPCRCRMEKSWQRSPAPFSSWFLDLKAQCPSLHHGCPSSIKLFFFIIHLFLISLSSAGEPGEKGEKGAPGRPGRVGPRGDVGEYSSFYAEVEMVSPSVAPHAFSSMTRSSKVTLLWADKVLLRHCQAAQRCLHLEEPRNLLMWSSVCWGTYRGEEDVHILLLEISRLRSSWGRPATVFSLRIQ